MPTLFVASAAIAMLFPVPALSAWGASTITEGLIYNAIINDLSEPASLTDVPLTQFLAEDDDDDHEGDEDDEKDKEHDRKHKDKDKGKSDDNKGKDHDHEDKGKEHDHEDKEDDSPPKNHDKPGGGDGPLAQGQTVKTEEDMPIEIQLRATSDKSGALTFSIVDKPLHGELRELDSSNGTVIFDPSANFFGQDRFSFRVTDIDGDSHSATVTVLVNGVNDAPIAEGSEVVTTEGNSVSFVLIASDADGDELTYIIMSDPSSGTQTGIPPNLSYAPNNRFHGSDTITFKVSDGKAESSPATINITVKSQGDGDRKDNDHRWEKTPKAPTPSTVTSAQPTSVSPPPDEVTYTPISYAAPPDLQSIIPVVDAGSVVGIIDAASSVVAKDVLAPHLIFSASTIEAIAQSATGAIVTYSVKATDETDGEVAASCSPSSGTKFPLGRFNVVCYATDAAGNSALSSFVVIVREAALGQGALPAFLLPTIVASVLGAGGYFAFRFWKRPSSRQ